MVDVAGGVACIARGQPAGARPEPAAVGAGLFVLGARQRDDGRLDERHGVKVERELGRPIMSSLHAGWAFGGMAGAGFARSPPRSALDPRMTVAIVGVAARLRLLCRSPRDSATARRPEGASAGFTLPSRGVVLLAPCACW